MKMIKTSYKNDQGKWWPTPLYSVWTQIKQRCGNPKVRNYARYGGRGITVCVEWKHDFQSFGRWALSAGYIKGRHIDRIDNEGNYNPGNCRFVTARENNSNRRDNNEIVGVSWRKECSKWQAKLTYHGKGHSLGVYKDKNIAAFAYEFALYSIKEVGDE